MYTYMAGKSKRAGKRGGKRGGRGRRRASRMPRMEYAMAKQTIDMPADLINTVWRLNDINLSQFDRLTVLGRCYQYFRFTKIEMKFKPWSDTFIQQNNASVPYFYYVINKSDTLDCGTFNQLKDAGAKAVRFDDKTVTVAWKPVVSQGVIQLQPQPPNTAPVATAWASYRTSPWLSTDAVPADNAAVFAPSTVPHKGILYGVEQDITASPYTFGVEITVHAEFKKPLTFLPLGGVERIAQTKVVQDKTELAVNPPLVP